jgi:hypothetical protein
MSDEQRESEQQQKMIKLDGSYGLKDRSILTVITKDPVEGEREEQFEFPTVLIDMKNLNAALMLRLIKGYKIDQIERPEEDNKG